MLKAADLWDFPESLLPFASHFLAEAEPWAWVKAIAKALAAYDFSATAVPTSLPPALSIRGPVFIHPTVKLPPFGCIEGPAWIGPDCELRPGVFIRGNVIAGRGCLLGNSCEYKNALLLDKVETAHFNYVGDSVLGNKAHLGAGVICANLKLLRDEVHACTPDGRVPTGLRKLGALVGDFAEVGCNSVLQPGSILGRKSAIISMAYHGWLPPETLVRPKVETQQLRRPSL